AKRLRGSSVDWTARYCPAPAALTPSAQTPQRPPTSPPPPPPPHPRPPPAPAPPPTAPSPPPPPPPHPPPSPSPARPAPARPHHQRLRETRRRRARAEVMEAVRHHDEANLPQRAERGAELLRWRRRAVHEEPAVFEPQHRTPRAQTNPAEPHRPLAHPDRVR